MVDSRSERLVVDIDDVRKYDSKLARRYATTSEAQWKKASPVFSKLAP